MTASSAVESLPGRRVRVEEATELLAVAADPIRWAVLHRLAQGPACVCDLQLDPEVAPNLLSYHLKVLREAGLVTAARRGRWIDYRLADRALDRLADALPGRAGARR